MQKRALRQVIGFALGTICFLLVSAGLAGLSQAEEKHFAGSCDVTATLGYCMEYRGEDWTRQDALDDCSTAPGGAFGDSSCPAVDQVGVCAYLPRGTEESRIIYIFYAPMDIGTAKMSCPGTFMPAK